MDDLRNSDDMEWIGGGINVWGNTMFGNKSNIETSQEAGKEGYLGGQWRSGSVTSGVRGRARGQPRLSGRPE
jgi:hypothetical protein